MCICHMVIKDLLTYLLTYQPSCCLMVFGAGWQMWPACCRVVRRLVTLVSSLAHANTECEAAQKQAASASAAAKKFLEDRENKVSGDVQTMWTFVSSRDWMFCCINSWGDVWCRCVNHPLYIMSFISRPLDNVLCCCSSWGYWTLVNS